MAQGGMYRAPSENQTPNSAIIDLVRQKLSNQHINVPQTQTNKDQN